MFNNDSPSGYFSGYSAFFKPANYVYPSQDKEINNCEIVDITNLVCNKKSYKDCLYYLYNISEKIGQKSLILYKDHLEAFREEPYVGEKHDDSERNEYSKTEFTRYNKDSLWSVFFREHINGKFKLCKPIKVIKNKGKIIYVLIEYNEYEESYSFEFFSVGFCSDFAIRFSQLNWQKIIYIFISLFIIFISISGLIYLGVVSWCYNICLKLFELYVNNEKSINRIILEFIGFCAVVNLYSNFQKKRYRLNKIKILQTKCRGLIWGGIAILSGTYFYFDSLWTLLKLPQINNDFLLPHINDNPIICFIIVVLHFFILIGASSLYCWKNGNVRLN